MSIFFLHIPKTSGTSVNKIIIDSMAISSGIESTKIATLLNYNLAFEPNIFENLEYLGGHYPLKYAEFMPAPVHIFSFFRKPYSLLLSLFNHHKKYGLIDKSYSFKDFYREERYKNFQTKYLFKNTDHSHVCNESDFDEAICNLNNFSFVGIQENEESIPAMCRLFNFSCAGISRLNVGDYENTIADESQYADIINLNHFDYKLYEHALQLNKNFIIKSRESIFDSFFDIKEKEDLSVMVGMGDHVSNQGLYQRELLPHHTFLPFRWTSKKNSINLNVNLHKGKNYSLTIFFIDCSDFQALSEISIKINQISMDCSFILNPGFGQIYGSFISEEEYKSITIEINCPFAKTINKDDSRQLGISIAYIYISPVLIS